VSTFPPTTVKLIFEPINSGLSSVSNEGSALFPAQKLQAKMKSTTIVATGRLRHTSHSIGMSGEFDGLELYSASA
jgi:hypothetical protein